MNYHGVIIEESLENPDVLKTAKILETRVEEVTEKHQTPWLKQWTLHTVEIPEDQADNVAEAISHALDAQHGGSWYADFKNKTLHYIIFPGKIFRINPTNQSEYAVARHYGISLGIPEYQVDFSPEVIVE